MYNLLMMKMQELNSLDIEALLLILFGNIEKKNYLLVEDYLVLTKRNLILSLLKLNKLGLPISFLLKPNYSALSRCRKLLDEGWSYFSNSSAVPLYQKTRSANQLNLNEVSQFYKTLSNFDEAFQSVIPNCPFVSLFLSEISLKLTDFNKEMIFDYLDNLLIERNTQLFDGQTFSPNTTYSCHFFENDINVSSNNIIKTTMFLKINPLLELYKLHRDGAIAIELFEPTPKETGWYGSSYRYQVKIKCDLLTRTISSHTISVDLTSKFTYFGYLGINNDEKLMCYKFNLPIMIKDSFPFKLLNILLSKKRVFTYSELYDELDLGPDLEYPAMTKKVQDLKRELQALFISMGYSKKEIDSQLQQRGNGYIFSY